MPNVHIQDPKELAKRFGFQIVGTGMPVPLVDLTSDSRLAGAGVLFCAMPGSNVHGADFASQAIERGSNIFLTDGDGALRILNTHPDVCILQAENARLALSQVAQSFYPNMPERIVAVTGTNGKTSTASFVRQIWQAMDLRAVNFGTAGVEGHVEMPSKLTTPDPITLHKLLADLATAQVTHASMEASSHGLDQNRLDSVKLQAAGYTNLTRDHLDYHETFGDYFAAKAGLFDRVLGSHQTAVINIDDPFGETVRLIAEGRHQKVMLVGKSEGAHLRLADQRFLDDGQDIRVEYENMSATARVPLIGAFQAENLLVAMGLVLAEEGVQFSQVMEALPKLETVRGRMQFAGKRENGAAVFVDYAHTPDALETALKALRPHVLGRLVVVVGAGGDRDKGKRPLMGQAASEFGDLVFVTDDNPRTEDPAQIRRAVMEGANSATEVADRAEAILRAIDAAQAGDVVLIAGKGHETGQIVGDQILPFDDVEQASISIAALEGRE